MFTRHKQSLFNMYLSLSNSCAFFFSSPNTGFVPSSACLFVFGTGTRFSPDSWEPKVGLDNLSNLFFKLTEIQRYNYAIARRPSLITFSFSESTPQSRRRATFPTRSKFLSTRPYKLLPCSRLWSSFDRNWTNWFRSRGKWRQVSGRRRCHWLGCNRTLCQEKILLIYKHEQFELVGYACSIENYNFCYQVYKYEMRISDNRWCTRAVCSIWIRHCTILLYHQQVSRAYEW